MPFPACVASDKAVDWEFPLNAYGFSRPLTMTLNMVDPKPIPSSVKLLLPAVSCTTGGISLPAPLSMLRQSELKSQEMDAFMSRPDVSSIASKPIGDKPTLKEVKELMKIAEMQIPVDSKLMGKMMATCPNDEIMAKFNTMQVDSSCAATDGIGCYHGHNKLIGTSDDSDSDEADRRKLRMFDGISVQGSTILAARRRISKEPLSDGNITNWIKALPEQGA